MCGVSHTHHIIHIFPRLAIHPPPFLPHSLPILSPTRRPPSLIVPMLWGVIFLLPIPNLHIPQGSQPIDYQGVFPAIKRCFPQCCMSCSTSFSLFPILLCHRSQVGSAVPLWEGKTEDILLIPVFCVCVCEEILSLSLHSTPHSPSNFYGEE